MKILKIFIVVILIFGCNSNRELVNYLRECKNLESDEFGFVLIEKDNLKENLKVDDILRYVGSDEKHHYFIHYYDRTVKIQSRFKIEGSVKGINRQIGIQGNLNSMEVNGKFKDSYYIKVSSL